ncbi:phage tail protein [Photorhabdus sp. P32]|uniref:phage tail protein n=1 Tax=Photorhabdus sp. P32 TaxID=3117549 RepID=UPI00311B36D8
MNHKNDFKAFSISDNANIVSQRLYEESKDLLTGFPPNDVPTHLLNKVLRQSSTISSVVANFIATQSGDDVLDDGNVAKLTAQLNKALEQKTITKIPDASLTQKGIVQLTDKTGNSNTLAVTQKLVSDVNDNANSRLSKNQNGADIPDKNEFMKNLDLLETVSLAKNAVPSNRNINGKELGGDVSLSAGDVGAYSKSESDSRFIQLNTNTKTSGYILVKSANYYDDSNSRHLGHSGFLRPNGIDNLGDLAIHIAHPNVDGPAHARGISLGYGSNSNAFSISTYAFDEDGKFKGKKRVLTEDDSNKALLSVNGWWRCGDTGMIYQWGNVPIGDNQGKIVDLPILFPNGILSLHVTAISSALNSNTDVTSAYGKPLNKSQIHISASSNYNNNGISGVYFFVIGY